MATVSNYYEILEVSIDATFEEIKKSFQKKIRQEHPDKSSDENSQKIASKLIEAYKILSDENLRSEYNKQYEQQHQKANRGQCFDQINIEKQSNLVDYECEQCGEVNTVQIDSTNKVNFKIIQLNLYTTYQKDEDFVIVECIGCNLKLQVNLK